MAECFPATHVTIVADTFVVEIESAVGTLVHDALVHLQVNSHLSRPHLVDRRRMMETILVEVPLWKHETRRLRLRGGG